MDTMTKYFILALILLYFTNRVSGDCKIISSGVSDTDKKHLLNVHNNIRTFIAQGEFIGQPRGINIKRLKWDSKLQASAQKQAKSCVLKHQRATDDRWKIVGQNIYSTSNSNRTDKGANWSEAMKPWLDESAKYKYPSGFSKTTRHYTQLVWAETRYVGCGFAYFKNNGKSYKLYICNYGPGGNTGGAPYKTGTSGCEALC